VAYQCELVGGVVVIRAAEASPTPRSGDAEFSAWAQNRPAQKPAAPPPPEPPVIPAAWPEPQAFDEDIPW